MLWLSSTTSGLMLLVFAILMNFFRVTTTQELPTYYEYYTSGGIKKGLSDLQPFFTLNNKRIIIFSGSVHYFRMPKPYWRDRLRKLRSANLNCVQTYVPWNLHQPQENWFDFGNGGSDFQEILDLKEFIKTAQEEDLFVILRPGPYIDSEWEFGGFPSWLLRYKNMRIRTSDELFMRFVERYWTELLRIVVPLQFTKGGPIIAVQVENEYGNTKEPLRPIDTYYLTQLRDILRRNGIVELLFTSDTPSNGFSGTIPGTLATANFQENAAKELGLLKTYQPFKPLMVTEYWTGWYDHWTEKHHTRSVDKFGKVLEKILTLGATCVNLYMMHGGTSWGFLNGADINGTANDTKGYQPDVNSYDYDAPISENGDYNTTKYQKLKEIINKYNPIQVKQYHEPPLHKRKAYPTINITGELSLEDLVLQATSEDGVIESRNVLAMELLPNINNGSGQSYGYIVYRKTGIDIPLNSVLKIEGRVCDTITVLINEELKSKVLESESDLNEFGYWRLKDSEVHLGQKSYKNATLELVVENFGRNSYGKLYQFNQYKGLWQGAVLLNNVPIQNWKITPLEFKKVWINRLSGWKKPSFDTGPKLYRAVLNINSNDKDKISDTYVDTRGWVKGIVIVNGFVLARYCKLGPTLLSFLPGTMLRRGENEVLIFEHFVANSSVKFTTEQAYLK